MTAVRIEWAKVRARCHRWREEVDLLEEEMARVLRFFLWRSGWWTEQVDQKDSVGPQLEGETAYARRQAAVQSTLAERFAKEWESLPELIRQGRAGELEVAEDEVEDGDDEVEDGDDEVIEDSDSDGDEEEGNESEGDEEDPVPFSPQVGIKSTYVDEVLDM